MLLCMTTYRIANLSDSITRCDTRQSYAQPTSQMQTPLVNAVRCLRRRLHISGNEDRNDEGVDGDDTGHDHRYERLCRYISWSPCSTSPDMVH